MLKRGRRAISPLIATVVLIAFAVSIGVLVMNWGKDVIAIVGDCSQVKLEVQTINAKPLYCYDQENSKLSFMVKNSGSVDIRALKLSVTTTDFGHEEIDIQESSLKPGKTLTKTIDYSRQMPFKAEIVPVIVASGKEMSCLENTVVAESIEPCN